MFDPPHTCLTKNHAYSPAPGTPCLLRPVVTIGRVQSTSVTGFCGGCSPWRIENAERAGGSVLSGSSRAARRVSREPRDDVAGGLMSRPAASSILGAAEPGQS